MKVKSLFVLLMGCMSSVFAAQPIFSIEPSVKASKIIYGGQTGVAYYKLTNNTPLALYRIGVHDLPAGVSQDPVGSGLLDGLITCRSTFDLEPSASCLLKLNIRADHIIRPIKAGPKVCQYAVAAHPIYCSTPADINHILKVTKQNFIPNNAPTLTITPSTLPLVTGDLQTITVTNTSSSVTVNNIVADFLGTVLENKVVTINPNPGGGNACTSVAPGASCVLSLVSYSQAPLIPSTTFRIQGANSQSVTASASVAYAAPNLNYQTLLTSPLINADVWDNTPKIMSANYAFEGIEAVPNGESFVVDAGGAWNIISTPGAPYGAYTGTEQTANIANIFGYTTYYDDAMPVCFSQPILTSTINPTVFQLTLNTGENVTPHVASLAPNLFYNESSCVVIFGLFGNRIPPGESGAVYPTKVTIVEGSSNGVLINLTLVGPRNVRTSMTGTSIASGNPYVPGGGPSTVSI